MKATLTTSIPSAKSETGFSHLYTVSGNADEIKLFVETPNFKAYPNFDANGNPQVWTGYIKMSDPCEVIIRKDGKYALSDGAFNADLARLKEVEKHSSTLANKIADRTADKLMGRSKGLALLAEKEEEVVEEETTTKSGK